MKGIDITLIKDDKMKMETIIQQIRLKADACGDTTREQRARKGAYVDCIVMLKDALQHPNSSLPDTYADTEADGIVFCGKCGKQKE